jgi:hypothetical protein
MSRGKSIALVGLLIFIGVAVAVWLQAPRDEETAANVPAETMPVTPQASPAPGEAAGAVETVYEVDLSQSEVYWRIYRSGLMARLGHNHIISVGEMSGSIALGDDPAAAEWALTIPVQGLIVDDPDIRARYGDDFSSEPSENDIAGTKQNMLSEGVLNGEMFSDIQIHGTGFDGSLAAAMLPVRIELLGRTIETTLPAAIEMQGDAITVSGEFRLTHTDLGMEPFTALGGAMAVGEEIDFTYRIHAVAGDR